MDEEPQLQVGTQAADNAEDQGGGPQGLEMEKLRVESPAQSAARKYTPSNRSHLSETPTYYITNSSSLAKENPLAEG